MSPELAVAVFVIVVLGLCALDRDRDIRLSKALWLPVFWSVIGASRPVSAWLQPAVSISPEVYLDGSPLDRLIFASLLAAGIVVLFFRARRVGALIQRNQLVLLLFLYCAASIFWSDYPDVAFRRWIKFVGNLVMVLIVLTEAQRVAAIKRLLARSAFVLLPVSLLLVKYYPDLGRTYTSADWIGGPWRPQYIGLSDTKNGLGAICLLFGLGALCQSFELLRDKAKSRRTAHLIAQGALVILALRLCWLADSMTSLSCIVLVATLIALANAERIQDRPAALHLLVAGMLSISVLAIFAVPNVLVTIGRDPTLTGRTDLWYTVLSMAQNPLFGTGFESFWLGPRLETIWNHYWWHPNEAHNGYIEIFLNLGIVGLALMALVMIAGYRNVIRTFRENPAEGRIRLAYLLVGIIYNLTESAFRMADPVWFLFLLAVCAAPDTPVTENLPVSPMDEQDVIDEPEPEVTYISNVRARGVV